MTLTSARVHHAVRLCHRKISGKIYPRSAMTSELVGEWDGAKLLEPCCFYHGESRIRKLSFGCEPMAGVRKANKEKQTYDPRYKDAISSVFLKVPNKISQGKPKGSSSTPGLERCLFNFIHNSLF